MLSDMTVGANDMAHSDRFYSAILSQFGYVRRSEPGGVVYAFPHGPAGHSTGIVTIYLVRPFDGHLATIDNRSMLAFKAAIEQQVRDLHASGLRAGGRDAGAPGFRATYSATFYVGYLRDDVGGKIALYCNNAPAPRRDI